MMWTADGPHSYGHLSKVIEGGAGSLRERISLQLFNPSSVDLASLAEAVCLPVAYGH
jgi:hypothetical protein